MPSSKATKTSQKRSDSAVVAFHSYYSSESNWGEHRWHQSLYPALNKSTRYCAVVNQYAPMERMGEEFLISDNWNIELCKISVSTEPSVPRDNTATLSYWHGVSTADKLGEEDREELQHQRIESFPAPRRAQSKGEDIGLLTHWNMDAASILPALILDVKPGHSVLDLCAAPGGKSVVLAQMLWPKLYAAGLATDNGSIALSSSRSRLHSNEVDKNRCKRLTANLKSYLPPQLFESSAITVLNIDGSQKHAVLDLPLTENSYDRVLVDAPCSSERHIIHAHLKAQSAGQIADEMLNWKPSHSKSLAKVQAALLMTALRAVKVDGKVVYATCSLASEENDEVINRVLQTVRQENKKHESNKPRWTVNVIDTFSCADTTDSSSRTHGKYRQLLETMTESTKFGRIALPDHPSGGRWGPLYFCLLEKKVYERKKKLQNTEESLIQDDTGYE